MSAVSQTDLADSYCHHSFLYNLRLASESHFRVYTNFWLNLQAFRANNIDSAKSRFTMCADDIREQLQRMGNTSELCSQLGAVLGMLGDCRYVSIKVSS